MKAWSEASPPRQEFFPLQGDPLFRQCSQGHRAHCSVTGAAVHSGADAVVAIPMIKAVSKVMQRRRPTRLATLVLEEPLQLLTPGTSRKGPCSEA